METHSPEKTILDQIVEARLESIAHRKRVLPDVALKIAVEKGAPPRDFPGALTRDGFNVIAELKKASPSRGVLRQEYIPAEMAASMERAGAAALSVLTEEEFFLGSLAHLKEAKKAVQIPILRKDFIVDPWQIWEARAGGADSFLLIVAILGDRQLGELLALGRLLKMEPLVEVHTREEIGRAIAAGRGSLWASIIATCVILKCASRLRSDLVEYIPDNCIAVSESGLHTHEDLARLRATGFDAFLVGETLMRVADPGVPLRAAAAPFERRAFRCGKRFRVETADHGHGEGKGKNLRHHKSKGRTPGN